jgi:hypothetical protein
MQKLDGEGYWLDSFSWHFLAEGAPQAIIEAWGREDMSTANDYQPEECSYAAHLNAFKKVPVTGIQVRDFRDDEAKECPGTI